MKLSIAALFICSTQSQDLNGEQGILKDMGPDTDKRYDRGQTMQDFVVAKSNWFKRPPFWDDMVRDPQYGNTWGYTSNKNLVNETQWNMDAPPDYVVDANDGSNWSFENDMLMTDYEEE